MSDCWWLCLGHGTLKIKWIGLKMRNYTASGEPPKLPWLIFNRSSILCILHRSTGKTAGNWIFHQPTILCKSSTTSIVSAAEFRIVGLRPNTPTRPSLTRPNPSRLHLDKYVILRPHSGRTTGVSLLSKKRDTHTQQSISISIYNEKRMKTNSKLKNVANTNEQSCASFLQRKSAFP